MTPGGDVSDLTNSTLGRILRERSEQIPSRTWLMSEQRAVSFGEANDSANRYAAGLAQHGITKGDRVAIYMEPSIEFVLLALAINKLGAVWVPVNTSYRGDWLRNTMNSGRAGLIVTDAGGLPAILAELACLDCRSIICANDSVDADASATGVIARLADFEALSSAEPPAVAIGSGDTAAILWTSGTTGAPKGVMQSHNVWIQAAVAGNATLGTLPDDRVYSCLPFYNSASWSTCIFRSLVGGIPCAIDAHFSVRNFWDRIRYYGATQTMTLGAMHMFLWNMPAQPDDADNPLRIATMLPFPENLITPFCERFGIEAITQGFGQSEVMLLLMRVCRKAEQGTPNALGRIAAPIELKLVDDEGNQVAPGETGEFVVKPLTPNVIFNGYFDQPEATAAAFVDGWYHTGDLGRSDADGEYFFVDRKRDYMRYKGRNISSSQVENVALNHPAVAACAAFGIPSADLESEHEIKLDVVLKPGTTLAPEALARYINDTAPYFFVPRYIEIRSSLPYTPTNKIEKYRLREAGVGPDSWDRQAVNFEVRR